MKITAELVKQLRDRTGVSMSKCKEALDQSQGDMEKAIDFLRKSGMASAVKKEGREVNEGLIGYIETDHCIVIAEVNSETDFVAQNEKFKSFIKDLCEEVATSNITAVADLMQKTYSKDTTLTVDQYRALVMQSLGENIQVRRILLLQKSSDLSVGIYSHMGGKIVTAVVVEGSNEAEAVAREIAMHTAAESPEYLNPSEVPEEVKARETEIARSQVIGKPDNIIEKIVEGKMAAFYDQVCLVCQKFVKDNSITIENLIEMESKKSGKNLRIGRFIYWKVGG